MFKTVKKVFKKIVSLLDPQPEPRNIGRNIITYKPKPSEYWHELAEHVRLEKRAEEFHREVAQPPRPQKSMFSSEEIRSWRENNAAVNAYLFKQQKRMNNITA